MLTPEKEDENEGAKYAMEEVRKKEHTQRKLKEEEQKSTEIENANIIARIK